MTAVAVGLVARRSRRDEAHPEAGRPDHQRDAHVVAVAEIGEAGPGKPAQLLANRHQVGERLAGMRVVREPVDHGDVGGLRQLLDVVLLEGADHDRVEVAGQDGAGVADRLAPAQLQVVGREVEAVAAELADSDLERDTSPCGGLLEDHPQRAAGEELVRLAGLLRFLERVGDVEHSLQLVGAPAADAREVAALQVLRNLGHRARAHASGIDLSGLAHGAAASNPASSSRARSRCRPVNIRLLIVPSGSPSRSASSDCV